MHTSSLGKTLRHLNLLIITVSGLSASALTDYDSHEVNRDKELTKRGTSSGAPNDYGPAIKITSSILQLTKSAEGSTAVGDIGLQQHETTLEHPWIATIGHELPVAHTIWLDWPTIQRDFHLLPIPDLSANNEPDFLQPHDEAASVGDAGASIPESSTQFSKGLHTQIISSSNKDVPHVSDNLDFGEANDNKAQGNYRTSYGR